MPANDDERAKEFIALMHDPMVKKLDELFNYEAKINLIFGLYIELRVSFNPILHNHFISVFQSLDKTLSNQTGPNFILKRNGNDEFIFEEKENLYDLLKSKIEENSQINSKDKNPSSSSYWRDIIKERIINSNMNVSLL